MACYFFRFNYILFIITFCLFVNNKLNQLCTAQKGMILASSFIFCLLFGYRLMVELAHFFTCRYYNYTILLMCFGYLATKYIWPGTKFIINKCCNTIFTQPPIAPQLPTRQETGASDLRLRSNDYYNNSDSTRQLLGIFTNGRQSVREAIPSNNSFPMFAGTDESHGLQNCLQNHVFRGTSNERFIQPTVEPQPPSRTGFEETGLPSVQQNFHQEVEFLAHRVGSQGDSLQTSQAKPERSRISITAFEATRLPPPPPYCRHIQSSPDALCQSKMNLASLAIPIEVNRAPFDDVHADGDSSDSDAGQGTSSSVGTSASGTRKKAKRKKVVNYHKPKPRKKVAASR